MNDMTFETTDPTDGANPSISPAEAPVRPGNVPEKFWDAESASIRSDALLKSYLDLERRLGDRQGPALPPGPEGYAIREPHELLTSHPELNARLHSAGFNQQQAQLVYDLAAEYVLPLIADINAEHMRQHEVSRLAERFGGEGRWQETARQLKSWGQSHLPAPVFRALAGSYEGVLAMHAMMNGGEPGLLREGEASGGAMNEGDLRELMQDPRYWRDNDPEIHRRVREGYERLYPGKAER